MATYEVTALHDVHGSIARFEGTDTDGNPVIVAADIRCAGPIAEAIDNGDTPTVAAEAWAVTHRYIPAA